MLRRRPSTRWRPRRHVRFSTDASTAVSLSSDDSTPPPATSTNAVRRLFSLYEPEKKPLAISLAALSVSASVDMALPYSMGRIVDVVSSVSAQDAAAQLPLLGGALSAAFIAGFAANVVHDNIQIMIGERIACRLRDRTYRSLMRQELAFFDGSRTGDLASRLSADTTVVGKTLSDSVSNGFHGVALTTGGTAMLYITSPQLACVMLGIIPVVAAGGSYYGTRLKKLTKEMQKALSDATVVADEKLTHVRVVKWFATEQKELQRYFAKTDGVVALARKRSLASASFFGGVDLSVKMSTLAVLGYGGQLVADGVLTTGELTSFLMYTLYVGFSFTGLTAIYADIMKGIGASSRIFELLSREPKIRSLEHWTSLPPSIKGHIQFEDVRFRYPTRPDSEIFRGLNLEVNPNETIALVGPSGCGKSSVIGLLARFYELDSEGCGGRIMLDGVDIATLNTTELRGIVGAVSQEPPLFACSIRDNIAYGCQHEATMEEIIEAAKAANAHDFISSFPDGYDTVVGERGQALSGGQKQRVAIARALIKKPKLLILDEATSALDPESESLVQSAVDRAKKDRTVILVAHRLSTIKSADRIAVIFDGEVAEQGTFEELSAHPDSIFSQVVLHGQH